MAELDYDYLARLVRSTLEGNSESFAELYAATYEKQYSYAYRYVKDAHTAQDILQDVYVLALNKLHTLRDPRLFISWLNQITFRVCYDYKKKMDRSPVPVDNSEYADGDILYSSAVSPEKEIIDRYEQAEMMSQILDLKPVESQAIIMRYYHRMTIDEIAQAMDCSRSTVKRRIASGKATLIRNVSELDWGGVFDD